MEVIHPTLASGQQGAEIANLHEALDRLEFGGPVTERERHERRYGDGTFDAIQRLQNQFSITQQFGVVEEQTPS
jgi:hypothetical protein